MAWTDDPVRDFERYDAEQAEKMRSFPTCSICGEVVYDDYITDLYGDIICNSCLEDFREEILEGA